MNSTHSPQTSTLFSAICALSVSALLLGCSAPGTRVVLLPQEDGSPSAVVVGTPAGKQTLSRPYERATALQGASKAPTMDLTTAEAVRKENGTLFSLLPPKRMDYTLYFVAGGTTLVEESQATLRELVATALQRPGSDIVVTGHTDTLGNGQQNDALSRRRAQDVVQQLAQAGFPAQRMEAVGRGERDLVVPTADEVDEPRNRRVSVQVR